MTSKARISDMLDPFGEPRISEEFGLQGAIRALAGELRAAMGDEATAGAIPVLRDFLDTYLGAGPLRLCRGTCVNARGEVSRSDALLLVDTSTTPFLPIGAGEELVPIEAVAASIHVGSSLDEATMDRLFTDCAELKALHPQYGADGSVLGVASFVVSFGGLVGENLLASIAKRNAHIPFELQPDVVVVLDAGAVTFVDLDPDGSVTVGLPPRAGPRFRLSWLEAGMETTLLFCLLLWESIHGRVDSTSASFHMLLRLLTLSPSQTLPLAYGIDRGE